MGLDRVPCAPASKLAIDVAPSILHIDSASFFLFLFFFSFFFRIHRKFKNTDGMRTFLALFNLSNNFVRTKLNFNFSFFHDSTFFDSTFRFHTIRFIIIYLHLLVIVGDRIINEKKNVFKFFPLARSRSERISNRVRNLSCRGRITIQPMKIARIDSRIPMKLTRPSIIRHMHGMHGNEGHRRKPVRLTMHNSRYLCRPARNLE